MSSRDLWVRILANVDGFQAGIGKAQQSVSDFDKSLQQSAQRRQAIEQLGSTFGKIGLVAAGAVALATKSAMDWETAWAGVEKTVDGTATQMAELEGQLREMARTMPATHAEIAAVAEAAGQLGVATENVAEFSRVMIQLGETTNLTADEAATSIAQMTNIMQTAPEDVDNLAAALVALGNNGASTERDIIQMAQSLAGAAKVVGMTEAEALAMANALASVGIEAEAGGSAVSRILMDMSKAVQTNSADLATWAETANMSVEQFSRTMTESPAQAFDAFVKGLGDINAAGGDVFSLLDSLGQSDIRVSRALLGMAGAGDLLTNSLELGAEAWAENTALATEYEKRAETTAAQVQVAWNQIKDNLIDVGAAALPVVKDLTGAIADLTGWFSDLPQPLKESSLQFLALTAAIGGTVWAGSRMVTGFSDLANWTNNLTGATDGLTRQQLLLKGGLFASGMALTSFAGAIGEGNRELGVLAQILGPTAMGAAFGPWGAALGGAVGVVSVFASQSREAAEAQRALHEAAAAVAQTLDQQTGALTEATTAVIRKNLADSGALAAAARIGASAGDLLAAAEGDAAALARVTQAADEFAATLDGLDFQRRATGIGDISAVLSPLGATIDAITGKRADISATNLALYQQAGAFGTLAFRLAEAAGSTDEYATALDEIPAEVRTRVLADGANASREDVELLAAAYDLTPEEVITLLDADDQATPVVLAAQSLLAILGDTTSTPTATLHDQASALINSIGSSLTNLNGSSATVTVRARLSSLASSLAGPGGSQAVRNLFGEADGGVVDYFGNGGFSENHVAQIAPAGSWRVWAEPETGGEAYIPLHPSKRSRSIDIWAEAGKRLGVQGFADGGFSGGLPSNITATLGDAMVELSPASVRAVGDYMLAASQNVTGDAFAQATRAGQSMRPTAGVTW